MYIYPGRPSEVQTTSPRPADRWRAPAALPRADCPAVANQAVACRPLCRFGPFFEAIGARLVTSIAKERRDIGRNPARHRAPIPFPCVCPSLSVSFPFSFSAAPLSVSHPGPRFFLSFRFLFFLPPCPSTRPAPLRFAPGPPQPGAEKIRLY